MTHNFIETHSPTEETDSWVYSYTSQGDAEPMEGDACKIVSSTRASKYSYSLLQEAVTFSYSDHIVLATPRNTLEVEAQGDSIAFKICEKGLVGHETQLTLSLKDAWVVLGLLTQAIENVSSARSAESKTTRQL